MKACSKCKSEKPETDFYFRSAATGKRQNACKECLDALNKVYREEHREKTLANMRNYYVENRERLVAQFKIYNAQNREKILAQKKVYHMDNREARANYQRLHLYGITPDAFKRMLIKQGGVCAICGGLGVKRGLCIDHDHDTGKVRGLLCSFCNRGLGLFRDSSDITRRATKYLKQHGN